MVDLLVHPMEGVFVKPLKAHADSRGTFTEIYRREWGVASEMLQWNLVRSQPNVMRGVHLHHTHADYLIVIEGELLLALVDLREDSSTHQQSLLLPVLADPAMGVHIPQGVAHGFYFPGNAIYCYAVSDYWSPHDELGCHWNDPGLHLDWPCVDPILSPRDQTAGSLAAMLRQYDLARASERQAA